MVRTLRRMLKDDFGGNLRKFRLESNLTQEKLALEAGLSLRFIQNLESGERQPSLETLFKLSRALNTTPAALINTSWNWWIHENKDDYS
jgi:transcriptional regulator with XRE-family HTH domain